MKQKQAFISFNLIARKDGVYIRRFKLNGVLYKFDYRFNTVSEAMQAIHDFVDFMDQKKVS